ncbi:MAG: hypothetical protein U0930_12765 [Pirellulales bacterium]
MKTKERQLTTELETTQELTTASRAVPSHGLIRQRMIEIKFRGGYLKTKGGSRGLATGTVRLKPD